MPMEIQLYDTTLRDGTQGEQTSLSAEDKLRILQKLDEFGIPYIEGGWPGASPRDARFFEMARSLRMRNARLVAFGSTRAARRRAGEDENIRALLETELPTVAVFGKSWDLHATDILGVSPAANTAMIAETVAYLQERGREVFFDAEHFFDGFRLQPDYALETVRAAAEAGARTVVLCDTNGGSLPEQIAAGVRAAAGRVQVPLGIHAHNDCGLAVANSLAAVAAGVTVVQGTVNGYGERCGNADLISVIGNLQFKLGRPCVRPEKARQLTELSRYVSEVANITPFNQRPFVGKSAFAHKGGVHVSAILKNPAAYEHLDPQAVGNRRRVLVSDLAGKSNIEYKAREMELRLGENGVDSRRIVEEIKRLEDQGYQFEAAEGSLALLMKRVCGIFREPFVLESFRVTVEKDGGGPSTSHATIKISVAGEEEITAAEGAGPVSALDTALRKALHKFYPQIAEMGLVDFKVRVIDGREGTASRVRVQIESRDDREIWSTIGVSENIIEASWQALVDSFQYKLSGRAAEAEERP